MQNHLKKKPKEWGLSLPGELAKKISEYAMPTRNSGFDFKYDYFEDFDLNPTINDIPEKTRDKLLPF